MGWPGLENDLKLDIACLTTFYAIIFDDFSMHAVS